MSNSIRFVLAALMCTGMIACTKKVKDEPAPIVESAPPPVATQVVDDGKYDPSDLDSDYCLRQRVVYFDFDRSELKSEAQAILACHGKYLNDRPGAMVTLEGHADERGSREYNLGLGERRGNAVSSALQANGGSAGQLNVVSYGEERPTCAETNDDCWSRNRRVEIIYTVK